MLIETDWNGENIIPDTAYLVFNDNLAIPYDGYDVTDIENYLETNYSHDVNELKPYTTSDWLRLLYDCESRPTLAITDASAVIADGMEVDFKGFNEHQIQQFEFFMRIDRNHKAQEMNEVLGAWNRWAR